MDNNELIFAIVCVVCGTILFSISWTGKYPWEKED